MRPHVLARYEQDCRRFPPYTYDDHFCLVPEGSATRDYRALARVACASEREVLMGFLPGHTRRSQKGYTGGVRALEYFAEDTVRCALIGNSFHTTVVASLLSGQLRALGFAHVAVPPAVLTLRFMQELLDFEQSGRGRIVDELIDIQSHVVAPGALPEQLDPRINQEEEDALGGNLTRSSPTTACPSSLPPLSGTQAPCGWLKHTSGLRRHEAQRCAPTSASR